MNKLEEKRPLTLKKASEYLMAHYPEHYRDVKQLRALCEKSLIPHDVEDLCGLKRKVRFLVRIEQLIPIWKKQHKTA